MPGHVEACIAEFGRLDVLGNVAGIARGEHVTDVTVDQYRRMMGVNMDGPFFMAQAAIPHLLEIQREHRQHRLERGADGAGLHGRVLHDRGAVVQSTRALAMEFVKTPLRVNAIAPAGTSTNLVATYRMPETATGTSWAATRGMRGMGRPRRSPPCSPSSPPTRGPASTAPSSRPDPAVTTG